MRLLLAAAGVLSLVATGSPGPGVQTLYRTGAGPIRSFAQDGRVLAWFSPGGGRCNSVHVLSLDGVELTLPKPGTANVTCRWTIDGTPVALAVAASANGTAALWTLHENAAIALDYVVGAAARQPRERRFAQLPHTRAGAGVWLGGVAGDGRTLVYSEVVVGYVDQVACLSGGSCRRRIVRGGVYRIVGRRNLPIPGTKPALRVTASGGRIAYVRAAGVASDGHPVAGRRPPLEVRQAATGKLVARMRPDGLPVALALSPHHLVVLARAHGRLHVSWYAVGSGRRLGTLRVPRRTAPHLSASDRLVVFRVGRLIEAIDLASRRTHELAKAAATPVGLSLEGSRLAWAENVKGRGRIRTLRLGRR